MIKRILKDYFSFNSRERVAIILLCCLMAFFWVLPDFYDDNIVAPIIELPHKTENNGIDENALANDSSNHFFKQRNQAISSGETFRGILFEFNPNTISVNEWKKLGLREKTINTIQHYLQKGGRFRKADDLKKIWGMTTSEADRLIPYVSIPETVYKERELPKMHFENKVPAIEKKQLQKIDINQAGIAEWEALPGIGKALAARIIKFRNKLGGFTSIDQLGKTYGLSDSVFRAIQPYLVLEMQ
ncbi:MAG: helix-hairpin-helix domain-containing protein [Chitinophagaceae bacterium]|nr:helix-hairpin-helix domain-containing protein [Chitinophagaceae bacterium]